MAASVRVLGAYPNERTEITGTLAEIQAISGPEGVFGIPSDLPGVEMRYMGGAWAYNGDAKVAVLPTTGTPGVTYRLPYPGSSLSWDSSVSQYTGYIGKLSFLQLTALGNSRFAPGTRAGITADGYSVMDFELRGTRWLPVRPVDKRAFDEYPTGIAWVARTSTADNGWRAVTYIPSRDRLVAVAYSGTGNRVMTSGGYV